MIDSGLDYDDIVPQNSPHRKGPQVPQAQGSGSALDAIMNRSETAAEIPRAGQSGVGQEDSERRGRKRSRETTTAQRATSKRAKSAPTVTPTLKNLAYGAFHLPIKTIHRTTLSKLDEPEPQELNSPSGQPKQPTYREVETSVLIVYYEFWGNEKNTHPSVVHEKEVPKDQWGSIKRWFLANPLVSGQFKGGYVAECIKLYGNIDQDQRRQHSPARAEAEVSGIGDPQAAPGASSGPQAAPRESSTPPPATTAEPEPRSLDVAAHVDPTVAEAGTEVTSRRLMPLRRRPSRHAPDVSPTSSTSIAGPAWSGSEFSFVGPVSMPPVPDDGTVSSPTEAQLTFNIPPPLP
jgi:hypothetical protein